MPLKDLNAAGTFGSGLSSLAKTLNSLANEYASSSAPLNQLLASVSLSASIPDNATTQGAVQTLVSACALPTSTQYGTATAGRFTTQDVSDAQAIITAVLVAAYVTGKMQVTLPINDV